MHSRYTVCSGIARVQNQYQIGGHLSLDFNISGIGKYKIPVSVHL